MATKAASVEKRDFLVEVGTEELPPKALRDLELAFAEGIRSRLAEAGLAHGELQSFAAPRRIAVLVKRLVARQPDQDRDAHDHEEQSEYLGQQDGVGHSYSPFCSVAVSVSSCPSRQMVSVTLSPGL